MSRISMHSVTAAINSLFALYGSLSAGDAKALPAQDAPVGSVVYTSRFDMPELPEWSTTKEKVVPTGKSKDDKLSFLGECHSEHLILELKDLPKHEFLIVEADLLILKTWGGSEKGRDKDGPDEIMIQLANGPVLLHASFSSFKEFPQSFPDTFATARHKGLTGATATGLPQLPAFENPSIGTTAAYRLKMIVRNSDPQVALNFKADLKENGADNLTTRNESWGLANVRVSVTDKPLAIVDAGRFEQLWTALRAKEPVAANSALWELVSAGDAVLPMIKTYMDKSVEACNEQQVNAWIHELDAEDYEARKAASQKLLTLGRKVIPLIQKVLEAKPSLEVQVSLKRIIQNLESSLNTDIVADARLLKTLKLIGGSMASDLAKKLPQPPAFQPLPSDAHKEEAFEELGEEDILHYEFDRC